jgi:hypothetical protein
MEWIIRFCQQGNWFWQNKYNAALIKKSYLGIIASKYDFWIYGWYQNLYKTEDLLTQSKLINIQE